MSGRFLAPFLVAALGGCLANGDLFNARAPTSCPGLAVTLAASLVDGAPRVLATYTNGMDLEVNVLRPRDGRSVDLVLLDAAGAPLARQAPADALGPLRDGDFLRIPPGGTTMAEVPIEGDLAGATRVVMRERATLPDDRTTAAFCRGLPPVETTLSPAS